MAVTSVFVGTIEPRGFVFAPFTIGETSVTRLTFASLTVPGSDMVDATPLTLSVGSPVGESCISSSSIVTSAALAAQTTLSLGPGAHCVSLADENGLLAAPMQFALRVVAGETDTSTMPGTNTIVLALPLGGSTSRPFTTSAPGTASLFLSQEATEPVGLGLGIPRADSTGCFVGASMVTASADAVVSTAVDAGRYCVKVFDPGTRSVQSSVSMTLARP